MKIAVPVTQNNQVDEHFGHCEFYSIFSISDANEIIEVQNLNSETCGCKSNIAQTFTEMGVKVLLVGGIGGGAINVMSDAGIEVIKGCSGSATEIVKKYLAGSITDSGSSCQQHEHHHSHGESCKH